MTDFNTIAAYPKDLTAGDVFQVAPGTRWLTVTGPPGPSPVSGCVDVPCAEGVWAVRSDHLITRRWETADRLS